MIPYGRHHIDDDDVRAVVDCLRSGALTQGPHIDDFEAAIRGYVGARYAVAVASGTAALHLAALAADVGPGSATITSPITFVASANASLYAGGSALLADVDYDTVNMCPSALDTVLRAHPETRAVIPVHFGGLPCDMPTIRDVAARAGAAIIEDAAHALGSRYPSGERVGSNAYSLMTTFSFHPVKAIAAGEGGMITTNDERVYRRLLRLRSHGINKLDDPVQVPAQAETNGERNPWYYEMQELGFHYRITDIQSALALSQFKKIETFLARRLALVRAYDRAFASFRHVRPAQPSATRELSGHHLYVVRIEFEKAGVTRARLMQQLRDRQIGTQVHYIPVACQPYYRRLGLRPEDCPNAMRYYDEALSIPLYYDLTDEQQAVVIGTLRELVG